MTLTPNSSARRRSSGAFACDERVDSLGNSLRKLAACPAGYHADPTTGDWPSRDYPRDFAGQLSNFLLPAQRV
jgi:hypothetical protein